MTLHPGIWPTWRCRLLHGNCRLHSLPHDNHNLAKILNLLQHTADLLSCMLFLLRRCLFIVLIYGFRFEKHDMLITDPPMGGQIRCGKSCI